MTTRPLMLLARTFLIVSILIGVPAVLGTLKFGFDLSRMLRHGPPPEPRAPSGKGDTLVQGIEAVDYAARRANQALDSVALGITKGLFASSVCALLTALALFFTGQGLSSGRRWAQRVGRVVLTMLLLFGLLVAAGVGGPLAVLCGLLSAACGYGLWILSQRFA